MNVRQLFFASGCLFTLAGCSSDAKGGGAGRSPDGGAGAVDSGTHRGDSGGSTRAKHVVVIAFENHDMASIVGNTVDAPYINGELLPKYASASNFVDTLPILIVSEPHYVLMEAGTATFSDVTFKDDSEPSATNSTASPEHLSTQLDAAGLDWMSYQEGLDGTSGACPIHSSGFYQPKHDPFVFFQDVSGSPPSATNARCASHHAGIDAFFAAVSADTLPAYSFVTPNQCHDMHGQAGCPNSNLVSSGDEWLAANLPPVIDYAKSHAAAVFLVWDEGEGSAQIPFIAIGANTKPGYVSAVRVTHGSLVRTVENVFGLPALPAVQVENDFSDFFEGGALP